MNEKYLDVFINDTKRYRLFKGDVDERELLWHQDEWDREIMMLIGCRCKDFKTAPLKDKRLQDRSAQRQKTASNCDSRLFELSTFNFQLHNLT